MPTQSPLYIGLMSGTSMDGIDGVIASIPDNKEAVSTLCSSHLPFPDKLRDELFALQSAGNNEIHRAYSAANQLASLYAQCVEELIAHAQVSPEDIIAIGVHGQTIRHCPELGFSCQLNNPALLAELSQINVIADFRSRDIAAGGQGAPLVPAFHQAIFANPNEMRVIVNIGGFANLSILSTDPLKPVIGFDAGPGNILMDGWISRHQGMTFDEDGAWAAKGRIAPALLAALTSDTYFSLEPPKSTGRDYFNLNWLDKYLSTFPPIQEVDVQATLCAFTAHTIAQAIHDYAPDTKKIYLCGGGAYNRQLVYLINSRLSELNMHAQTMSTKALGVEPEHMEALAFAWLAHQFMQRLPGNLPAVTGAEGQRILGALYPASCRDD